MSKATGDGKAVYTRKARTNHVPRFNLNNSVAEVLTADGPDEPRGISIETFGASLALHGKNPAADSIKTILFHPWRIVPAE